MTTELDANQEEVQMFRDMVLRFLEQEILPHVHSGFITGGFTRAIRHSRGQF